MYSQSSAVGSQSMTVNNPSSSQGSMYGGNSVVYQAEESKYSVSAESMPYAPADSETKRRLFIVSHPERISVRVLSDKFSRFGSFISVNYIPGN